MKTLIALTLSLSIFSGSIFASGMKEFEKTMSNFYKMPTEQKFIAFQNDAESHKETLSSKNSVKLLISVMIARISEKHNWPIIENSFSKMAEDILQGKSKLAIFVNSKVAVSPTNLDIWWGSFLATGETKYLNYIYPYTGKDLKKLSVEEKKYIMVYGSASWSFKSNCKQHQTVLEFAKEKLKNEKLSEHKVNYLKNCIARA